MTRVNQEKIVSSLISSMRNSDYRLDESVCQNNYLQIRARVQQIKIDALLAEINEVPGNYEEIQKKIGKYEQNLDFPHLKKVATAALRTCSDEVIRRFLGLGDWEYVKEQERIRKKTHYSSALEVSNRIVRCLKYKEKKLKLDDLELTSLPVYALSFLTHLEELDCSQNHFQTLPPEIGKLVKLKSLDCSKNIHLEQLPPEIGDLALLETLNVSNCYLNTLPIEIRGLKRLKELELSYNKINNLPEVIGDLGSLEELQANNLGLETLPLQIARCTSLKKLHIMGNRIKELPDLPESLTYINCASNQIRQIPPGIKNLKNLQEINIAMNQLEEICQELGELTNLTYFSCSTNRITNIAPLLNLGNLNIAFLDENNIEELPLELHQCKSLKNLYLQHNALTEFPDDFAAFASQIEKLNISHNQIEELPPVLAESNCLRDFTCTDNPLSEKALELAQKIKEKSYENAKVYFSSL